MFTWSIAATAAMASSCVRRTLSRASLVSLMTFARSCWTALQAAPWQSLEPAFEYAPQKSGANFVVPGTRVDPRSATQAMVWIFKSASMAWTRAHSFEQKIG